MTPGTYAGDVIEICAVCDTSTYAGDVIEIGAMYDTRYLRR